MARPGQVGGPDVGSQLAAGLAPLTEIAASLSAQTNLLSGIHAALMGSATGVTPAQRASTAAAVGPQAGQTTTQTLNPAMFGGQSAAQVAQQALSPVAQGAPPAGTPTTGGRQGGAKVTIQPASGTGGGAPPTPPGQGGGGGGGGGQGGGGGNSDDEDAPAGSNFLAGLTQARQSSGDSGGGLVNRVYGMAVKKLPLLSVPNSIRNEYQSQVNKNNYYRSTLGVDNSSAFGYRFEEEANRFRYGRLFDEGESRMAQKGMLSLGYTDTASEVRPGRANFREAMDFAYQNKDKTGMTVQESLQVASVASKAATQNLSTLTDQLKDLGDAAAASGQSAMQARQNYLQAYSTAIGAGINSNAAPTLAAAGAATALGYGQQFANADFTSRMTSDSAFEYMTAGAMGVSGGQYTQMMQTSSGQAKIANANTGQFLDEMKSFLPPRAWAWLSNEVNSRHRSPDIVAQDFLSQFAHTFDNNAYLSMVQMFANVNPASVSNVQTATIYLIQQMQGHTEGAQLAGANSKAGREDASGNSVTKGLPGSGIDLDSLRNSENNGGIGGMLGRLTGLGGKTGPSAATQDYINSVHGGGQRYGGVDQMLKQMSSGAESSQMVEVETAGGKRVVSLDEAIKNYRAQIASGTATFVGGDKAGQNVSAYTGGAVDDSRKTVRAALAESRKKSGAGQTEDDYYKAHPDQKQGDKGWTGPSVQIDLTDRAASILQKVGYDAGDPTQPADNGNGFGSKMGSLVNKGLKFNPVTGNTVSAIENFF